MTQDKKNATVLYDNIYPIPESGAQTLLSSTIYKIQYKLKANMKNTLWAIILTVVTCLLAGCSSFYSDSSGIMKRSSAQVAQNSLSASTTPTPITPDLPDLEPIQTAQGAQTSPALPSAQTSSQVQNPFVNGGTLASLDSPKSNSPESESAIKVVRLPKIDSAKATDIQQVALNEPEFAPLPNSPEALQIATTQTIPVDNNILPENTPLVPEDNQTWHTASNTPKEPQNNAVVAQNSNNSALTMTPDVLDTDKNQFAKTDNSQNTDKIVALPKPMEGAKPMDSGVYLEEMPESTSNQQLAVDNSVQNIPDEIFDAPTNVIANNATPQETEKTIPSELEQMLDPAPSQIQQCSATEPCQSFQMKSLAFVTSIRKLGDFTAVEKPYIFTPGQTLLLYMEFENPNNAAAIKSGFEVLDSSGAQVLSQGNQSDAPTGEKLFFQYVKLALPTDIAPGNYTIRVWGRPANTQTISSSNISFQVK